MSRSEFQDRHRIKSKLFQWLFMTREEFLLRKIFRIFDQQGIR